uniref:Uncharacterized protein n=1 Tax=Cacopsylla melanoneura TaxID=428564 RepID=A0A8D9DWG5_9HEMI
MIRAFLKSLLDFSPPDVAFPNKLILRELSMTSLGIFKMVDGMFSFCVDIVGSRLPPEDSLSGVPCCIRFCTSMVGGCSLSLGFNILMPSSLRTPGLSVSDRMGT